MPEPAASWATATDQAVVAHRPDPEWDRYVHSHSEGTLFHTMAWHDAVLGTFGHKPHYLVAKNGERIEGVLPMFLVTSRLVGRMMVSVPYAVGGGILADDETVVLRLWNAARRMAEDNRCQVIDLRSERATVPGLLNNDQYVGFCRDLPEHKQDLPAWLPRKARAVVRNARDKYCLHVSVGDEHLSEAWRLYSMNMRRLASINYPRTFFDHLVAATPGLHWTAVVRRDDRLVAGLLTLLFKDRVLPYFFGSTDEARRCGAANYLYFCMMELAVEQGYRVFDFGRSRRDNPGSYDFKRFQGFDPRPLGYQSFVPTGQKAPNLSPRNRRFALARTVWSHLPLRLTSTLGARLSYHIPG